MAKIPNQNNLVEIINFINSSIESINDAVKDAPNESDMKKVENYLTSVVDIVKKINDINNAVDSKLNPKKISKFFADIEDVITCVVDESKKIDKKLRDIESVVVGINKGFDAVLPEIVKLTDNIKILTKAISGPKDFINLGSFALAINLFVVVVIYSAVLLTALIPFIPLFLTSKVSLWVLGLVLDSFIKIFEKIDEIEITPITPFKIIWIGQLILLLGTVITIIAALLSFSIPLIPMFELGRLVMFIWVRLLEETELVFEEFNKIKASPKTMLNIFIVGLCIGSLHKLIKKITSFVIASFFMLATIGWIPGAKIVFKAILTVISLIHQTIEEAKQIPSGISLTLKLKAVSHAISRVYRFLSKAITKSQQFLIVTLKAGGIMNVIKNMMLIRIYASTIKGLMKSVASLIVPALLIIVTYPAVYLGIKLLFNILKLFRRGARGKRLEKTVTSTVKLGTVIVAILAIAVSIIAIAIISVKAIKSLVLVTLFLVGLIAFVTILRIISFVINKLHPEKCVLTIALVALIVLELVIAAGAMLVLGIIAGSLVRYIKEILLFMVGLIVFVGIFALLGLALQYALPFIIIAAVAILVVVMSVVIVVGAILLIAAMLWLLTKIDLDKEEILAAVDTVFDIVWAIIDRLFNRGKKDKNETIWDKILKPFKFLFGSMGDMIVLMAGVTMLVLAVLAVGAILLIAGMLRLLQELDLKEKDILDNVDVVFGIVDKIINELFAPRDEQSERSSHGILTNIVSWFDDRLASVIGMAESVVYLFLAMISVGLILAIAGMLRLLQNIELDEGAISDNVNKVFSTVNDIISKIMTPRDEQGEGSSRGILLTIVGWVFGEGMVKVFEAALTISYLFLVMICIGIVIGIAKLLEQIQDLDINAETIKNKVNEVFSACQHIIDKVFSGDALELPEPENEGILGTIISFFSPDLGKIINALKKIMTLSVIFSAISAIKGIATSLQEIQNIDVDLNAASAKVDAIMGISENIAQKIFSKESKIKFPVPEKEKKSIFGALIDWAFGAESDEDRAIKAALKRVESLGIIAAAVGALGTIQDNVKKIMDIDFSDFNGASAKIDELMQMSANIAESIFSSKYKITLPTPSQDEIKSALIDMGLSHWYRKANAAENAAATTEASMRKAMRAVESLGMIASAVGSIGTIADSLKGIMDFNVPNAQAVKSKVESTMQIGNSIAFIILNDKNTGISGGNVAGIKGQSELIMAKINFAKVAVDGVKSVFDSWSTLDNTIKSEITGRDKISNSIKSVFNLAEDISNRSLDIDDIHRKFDLVDRITKSLTNLTSVSQSDVQNTKELTKTYVQFLEKINAMDIRKLNLGERMMRHFAKVTEDIKGDFNGLAKAVNENIAPVLNKLNTTLEEVNKAQTEILKELAQPLDMEAGVSGQPMMNFGGAPDPQQPDNTVVTTPPQPVSTMFNSSPNSSRKIITAIVEDIKDA